MKIPQFAPSARRGFKILILKNNCLQSLDGLEELDSLRELDISFNCIADHRLLWPLQRLSNLSRLELAGNPIGFHREHRSIVLTYLHSSAVKNPRLLINSLAVSKSELRNVPETLGNILPVLRPLPARDLTALTLEAVGNEEESVSDLSTSISSIGSTNRRKQMRFRTVQLDEPEEQKSRPAIVPTGKLVCFPLTRSTRTHC